MLPINFIQLADQIRRDVDTVEGYLSPQEMRFLSLVASVPTASGEILEIGSFKGKSTIVLAKSAALIGDEVINAVDPLVSPSETDPDLGDDESALVDFTRNVSAAGVSERVILHQMFSHELARKWDKPIRLLWIDGDHTYRGTKLDFDGFKEHLADGAIVAIHDVLHEFEGGIRVMMEDILLSPNFGACGFVGSIGWSRYHKDEKKTVPFRAVKLDYYKRLGRMIPFVTFGSNGSWLTKKRFKLLRWRVPHGPVDPAEWVRQMDLDRSA